MEMGRIGEHLDYHQMKTGSVRYCLNEIEVRLDDYDNERLESRVLQALRLNDVAARLEYEWVVSVRDRSDGIREGTVEIDNKIDRTVTAIYRVANTNAELPSDRVQTDLAEELVRELFPRGVTPITSVRFERQHEHVERLLGRLREDFSNHVTALGLDAQVDALEKLHKRFEEQIEATSNDAVRFDQVEAARVAGQDAFHKVLYTIYADYCDDDDVRRELLRPVEEQQRRIERYVNRRGEIPEVDPESGEPTAPVAENPESFSKIGSAHGLGTSSSLSPSEFE